nr:protein kinase [Xanthomonadales bacterium]
MLSKSPPARAERWKLLQQVAEALAAVHAAGIVHRNLTPDSILVDRRDGERVALLGEFGSAALDDRQRLVDLGIDPGELSLQTQQLDEATVYVAPECVAGAPATAASDVYALGAVIAQTLCGDFQRLEFSDVEDLPAEVTGLLQRCSAVNPATRPTAAELAAALRELSEPKPVRWQIERAAEPLAAALPAEVPDSVPAPADALAASAADLGQPASAPAEPASPTPVPAPEPAADAAKAAPVSPQAAAPIALTQPGFAPPIEPPQIHDRIGRYRILNELAQGGMGVVYLAEQNEPVQRRVALKLIRAGLDSAQVLARFAAERQALALMNHPNISAIFDAGTTPGGYPYFVM